MGLWPVLCMYIGTHRLAAVGRAQEDDAAGQPQRRRQPRSSAHSGDEGLVPIPLSLLLLMLWPFFLLHEQRGLLLLLLSLRCRCCLRLLLCFSPAGRGVGRGKIGGACRVQGPSNSS